MKCICVGGGDFAEKKFNYNEGDFVVAADSGYSYIKDLCKVNYIIGDLDSLGYAPKDEEVIKLDCHKDNSDMLEAWNLALSKGCDEFDIYGALGKRLDHTIANLQNAKALAEKNCEVKIIDINQTVYVTNKDLVLENIQNKTVSIFAYDNAELSLKGFEYPLDNYLLTNNYPLGLSNVALSEQVLIEVNKGVIMVIVNDKIN